MVILVILGDKMANISLIDYLFGLYININVNEGQNKFEVYLKQWAQNSQSLG